ncbi:MAG: TatD family hydrolase [Candidatus Aenigmatarchaeota archaeon]
MIDTHCHLTYKGLDEIKDQVISEARKDMFGIVTCGLPEDADKALQLSAKYPDFVHVTLGLHPTDVLGMNDEQIESFKQFITKNKSKIIAIGEIGLDYHWIKDEKDIKKTKMVFVDLIYLAKQLNLPIILHSRKAEEDVLKIIVENDVRNATFHSYTGNITLARQIIEEGYYISINTNIMNSKNSKKIAKSLPLEMLLTETDAPFLSPFPGKPNVPQNVKLVVEAIAKLRGEGFDEVNQTLLENCKTFFNIE